MLEEGWMRDWWMRAGGLAGIAGVVVGLATFPMVGSSPKSSASVSVIASYVARHQTGLRLVGVLVVLASALLSWFAGTFVWDLFDRDRRSPVGVIALLGASGMVMFLAWDGMLEVALSFAARQGVGTGSVVSVLYTLENGVVMPGAYGFLVAVFLVAVAAAALRGIVLSAWVGYLSLLLAGLSVAGGSMGLSSIDGGMSSPVSYAPVVATSVVPVIIAVGLLRRRTARVEQHLGDPAELSTISAG
jgi:hypothetical protein